MLEVVGSVVGVEVGVVVVEGVEVVLVSESMSVVVEVLVGGRLVLVVIPPPPEQLFPFWQHPGSPSVAFLGVSQ